MRSLIECLNIDKQVDNIVKQLQKGDPLGLEKLLDLFGGKLYSMSYTYLKSREEAEEVVQDVLLRVWQSRKKISLDKSFDGYLFMITKNLLLNKIRNKSRRSIELAQITADVSSTDHTDQLLLLNEMNAMLEMAMDGMPSKRQKIFRMSRIECLSNKQIAQQLGLKEKTVENQIGRAIKYLKAYISYVDTVALLIISIS